MLRKPQLKEDLEDDDELVNNYDVGEPPPDLLDHQNNFNNIQRVEKRYKCHSCEPPNCSKLTTCYDALQCWKSRVRETNGIISNAYWFWAYSKPLFLGDESVTRGCTKKEEQLPLFCKTLTLTVQHKRQASGQFQIECCSGDLCNDGNFPELPPLMYPDDIGGYSESLIYGLKLVAAVLGPVVVFSTIGVIALYFLRRYYRNRSVWQ